MNTENLVSIVQKLVAKPKGILAIDESANTCNARFESVGIEQTEENRRAYRELLVTCPGLENYVSGFIMFDETIKQSTTDGASFVSVLESKGIVPGIKVDQGLQPLEGHEGEETTKGLDGLKERLENYYALGARFTKWRAVYHVSDVLPSEDLMRENARTLASYAKIVQEVGMVPMIEPEVLITGTHSIERCEEVTARNLEVVFEEIAQAGVYIPGLILKTSMVISGLEAQTRANVQQVAEKTIQVLTAKVPADIGGVVFLSGGQADDVATAHLQEMHAHGDLPWPLTFSYSRAIQNDALKLFAAGKLDDARQALLMRAKNNSLASIGAYVG
jgi:fructose-bisphosphate aldolase class I